MGQKKLIRFAELKTFENVLQYPEDMRDKWKDHFQNNSPITLELACGKGEYTVGLAARYPEKNFIGIDLKGNRLWVGAKKCIQQGINNAAFLRIHIDKVADHFSPGKVKEIWITFPDPQLRTSKAKKRLTHPKFLRLYKEILEPGGLIHLKTDSPALYNFTKLVIEKYGCVVIEDLNNIYSQSEISEELKIKTHYESLDIAGSNKIHYLKFSLPEIFPEKEADKALHQYLKEHESE